MAMEWCKEIMLFGTRIVVDSMRKTASLNNLMDYQHAADAVKANQGAKVDGYVSDNVGRGGAIRERKRGTPWSEEEHKLFLIGLKKVGKGDWRGISKNFVKTRTPTQVASHAQKYFLRHTTVRSRRRTSLFDITTETVAEKPTDELAKTARGESIPNQAQSPTTNFSNTHLHPMVPTLPPSKTTQVLISPVAFSYPLESSIPTQVTQQQMTIERLPQQTLQLFPSPNTNSVSNSNCTPLSLNLGLSLPLPSHTQASPYPALQTLPRLMSTDSYISVA